MHVVAIVQVSLNNNFKVSYKICYKLNTPILASPIEQAATLS